jgi:mRNA interferase MazF
MKQNEIWLTNLDPTVGAEIKKTRPVLIVSENDLGKLPLRVIVPITDWKEHYAVASWMVKLEPTIKNGLDKLSSADCFQVRSVSQERLVKKLGEITGEEGLSVKNSLTKVFGIVGC